MNRILLKLLFCAALLLFIIPADPVFASQQVLNAEVPVRLSVAPGGTLSFPVKITIPDGSYIYANPKGPGIGKATALEFSLPAGFRIVHEDYPAGEKYTPAGFDDHVFIWKKSVMINVTLFAEPSLKQGKYQLGLNINMLQCTDVCIPFDRNYKITVEISGYSAGSTGNYDTGTPAVNPNDRPAIAGNTGSETLPAEFSHLAPVCIDKRITGIIQAVLLGIIAGFILNLMPCVLPVVSLKVMALVHHREAGDGKDQRNHGIVFSAGIITSFLLLASLASFSGYKWGGLFQQAYFVSGMAVFVFAMALSLFGVFTINIPGFAGRAAARPGSGYSDSFTKGVLATLLATPCSGPFLGGVLAWALIQPSYIIFIIFASVGFGMALPYILIALIPALASFIPRPGNWMNVLEAVMGFLLVFTSVYLLSFLGHDGAISTMIFMVFVSMGLWQYGRFGNITQSKRSRTLSTSTLAALVMAGFFISFYLLAPAESRIEETRFSIEKLEANRVAGRITVISFTADWCPNCKLVEKTVLNTKRVRKLFDNDAVEFMVADITRKNLPAEELMSRLGSSSIPFLAVFPAGDGFLKPVCLRDIYSAGDLETAVKMAKKYSEK